MKPCRCRVCVYVGCVNAGPFQKRQTLLIYKAYMEILWTTEGHGVTSEVKGKSLRGTSPAPGRQPTVGTEAPLQAWDGYGGTREEQTSPSFMQFSPIHDNLFQLCCRTGICHQVAVRRGSF